MSGKPTAGKRCPICGSESGETFRTSFVGAAKCTNPGCGHIFAVDAPPGFGVQHIPNRDELLERYHERNIQLIQFLQSRNFLFAGVRLLDVGAGSGHLLRSLKTVQPSIDVTCLEADPNSAAHLKGCGFPVYAAFDQLTGKFDSVLLVEVIEHIDDPISFLQVIRTYVGEKGRVFVTTPCGETRTGSRATNAYDTREHVQFFTERSLDLCFRKAGFAGFQFETINAMTSMLTMPPLRYVKDLIRPLRARATGHVHLTGFSR